MSEHEIDPQTGESRLIVEGIDAKHVATSGDHLLVAATLERLATNPVVTLNRAVALAMVRGPRAGLDLVDTLSADDRVAASHHFDSARAHLLELAGDHAAALAAYQLAARRTRSLPERQHLLRRASRLSTARRGPAAP